SESVNVNVTTQRAGHLNDPFVIPEERLPPGFAETVDHPPDVIVEPKRAATAVLARDGSAALEVLLLKRHRSSGFVPGAYVFPGGRVDEADAQVPWPPTVDSGSVAPSPEYWVAAVREIFEETGVLLARSPDGGWSSDASSDPALELWRERLMAAESGLNDVLSAGSLRLDASQIVYIAHWITPVVEPRRFDTRFFFARLPELRAVRIDAREMDDALWLSPIEALERFEAGRLPMVFPTVKTLQMLQPYRTVDETLAAFRQRTIAPILPRLVRAGTGVGIVIDRNE
ncbi:MAG: NUDIX hydrolase, partial [Longimicrobiales bacterium]